MTGVEKRKGKKIERMSVSRQERNRKKRTAKKGVVRVDGGLWEGHQEWSDKTRTSGQAEGIALKEKRRNKERKKKFTHSSGKDHGDRSERTGIEEKAGEKFDEEETRGPKGGGEGKKSVA